MSTTDPSLRLELEDIRPLLHALDDPDEAVRTAALRALVRLPLAAEASRRVARFIGSELETLLPGSTASPRNPAAELLDAAAYGFTLFTPDHPPRRLIQIDDMFLDIHRYDPFRHA